MCKEKEKVSMQQITVKVLYELVQKEMLKGNGDKMIVLSDDNEGNGYHGMFFGFVSAPKTVKATIDASNGVYDSVSENPKEIVILG